MDTKQVAEANCKLTISGPQNEKRLRLVATRPIPRMTEVLWNYSGCSQSNNLSVNITSPSNLPTKMVLFECFTKISTYTLVWKAVQHATELIISRSEGITIEVRLCTIYIFFVTFMFL